MPRDGISVIVPAYNEAESLPFIVQNLRSELAKTGANSEILVVDDGSDDGTGPVAEALQSKLPNVRTIHHKERRGKTKAIITGLEASTGTIVVVIDADLQYDPSDLHKLAVPIIRGEFDIVSGWRTSREDTPSRRIASKIYNALVALVFASATADANSGFKAFRREVLESLSPLMSKDFHRYMLPMGRHLGYRVKEIPISHYSRKFGESKYDSPFRLFKGTLDLFRARIELSRNGASKK